MTSKERVIHAINHQETDRVPITFDAEKEVYTKLYDHFQNTSKRALFDQPKC